MASKTPKFSYEQEMKELVAEQRGFLISILGIVIALFFGLAVKALIAPNKVREKIVEASSRVHSEMQFEIGEAFVSLADGIFPELAVVIRDIKMTSEKACWMRPQVEIDQIKLPLSMTQLLKGNVYIHEVIATEAALTLRSTPVPCTGDEKAAVNTESAARAVAQAVTQEVEKNQDRKSAIDTVRVKKIIVSYLPVAFTSFELDNLSVKASSNKDFELKSLLRLGGGTLTGDYSSQAQLLITHMPSSGRPTWNTEVKGLLREGHYDFVSSFDPETQVVDLNLDVKHLPLSQIFPILQKYKVFTAELNGKRLWLTLNAKIGGKISELKHSLLLLKGFRVEGDLGEISTPVVEINSLEPFKMKPLEFDLRGFDLNHLLTFLNRPHPSQALGDLGIFNGKAFYQDVNNVRLSGEHSGLQFIFSNKGTREVQTLSLIAGDLLLQEGRWNVNVDSIKPSQGLFDGDLKLQASKDWRELNLKTNIRELILAPSVQKIMTAGGDIGSVSGKVNLNVKNGEVQGLNGNLNIQRMLVESIEMKQAKVSLTNSGDNYFVEANALSMEMNGNAKIVKYVSQVLPDFYQNSSLSLKNAKMKMKTQKLSDFYWSEFSTTLVGEKPVLISSNGGWNPLGALTGNVRVRQNGKELTWKIEGSRDFPVLVKKTP